MKHKFEGGREPNTANGPGESWSDCVNCGASESEENRDEECVPEMDADLLREFTSAMRAADETFQQTGGGTRHYLRDCLWPEMQKRGLSLTKDEG